MAEHQVRTATRKYAAEIMVQIVALVSSILLKTPQD